MKSSINQPMKSALLRAVLCGAFALSAAAPWNTARGVEEAPREGGRGAAPKTIHQKLAPKPLEHPKVAEKRELPGQEKNAPKPRLHDAPRIANLRRPVPFRHPELVARLRHELFSHRWSFVYAEGLRHAPKSLRFRLDGTVETEIKGEKWYWVALDERRVSLRTLADESQPGITLEFNEGYTGFQYVLPDKTIAVQGTTLNAIAEGPELSRSAPSEPSNLEEALLNYPWKWHEPGKSYGNVRFEKNKSLHVAGRTFFWNVAGPQTLHLQFENGDQKNLLFDQTFSTYSDGDQISGSRETEDSTGAAADSKP